MLKIVFRRVETKQQSMTTDNEAKICELEIEIDRQKAFIEMTSHEYKIRQRKREIKRLEEQIRFLNQ